MNTRKSLLIAALSITGLVGFAATPASAEDTTTTFTLTGGSLSLTVGATAALGNEASGVAANTITGTLGTVVVTDGRGGTADWVASAASTTFSGLDLSESTDVAYTNGAVTTTGTTTVEPADGVSIAAEAAVATATGVSGNNTASWNPTLDVSMPAGALAGAYSGVVTTSLA
jgi:hypothetical protein